MGYATLGRGVCARREKGDGIISSVKLKKNSVGKRVQSGGDECPVRIVRPVLRRG